MNTDAQLLERYIERGDRIALETLFARHYPAIHRAILHMVHDSFDAQDLTQSTFLQVIRGRHTWRGGTCRRWLLTIAINEVRQFRRRGHRRPREDWLASEVLSVDPAADVPRDASRREFEQALERALEHMPAERKDPLVLHYYESLSYAEIGEVLDLPKSTVQSRLGKAIDELRKRFRGDGCAALLPMIDGLLGPQVAGEALTDATGSLAKGSMLVKSKSSFAVLVLVVTAVIGACLWQLSGDGATTSTDVARDNRRDDPGSMTPQPGNDRPTPGERSVLTAGGTEAPVLFGRVLDDRSDAPVAGATVSVYDFANRRRYSSTTDDQGRFTVEETRAGRGMFHLVATRDGFARGVVNRVSATAGEQVIRIAPGFVIVGQVTTTAGDPVTSFEIRAIRLEFQESSEFDSVRSVTLCAVPGDLRVDRTQQVDDVDGRFEISDLREGKHFLVVNAPGHAPTFFNGAKGTWEIYRGVHARRREKAEPVRIELKPTGTIYARVTDAETGQPIVGAEISLGVTFASFYVPVRQRGVTPTPDGRYPVRVARSDHDTVASLDLVVRKRGYGHKRLTASGHSIGSVFDFKLGRTGKIRGRVFDLDGSPIPDILIFLREGQDANTYKTATTGPNGDYLVEDVAPIEPLRLLCLRRSLDGVFASVATQIAFGEERTLDIGGPGESGVFGRVLQNGKPCRGCGVSLSPAVGTRGFYSDARTGDDGFFRLDRIPAGEFAITFDTRPGSEEICHRTYTTIREGHRQRLDVDFDRVIHGVVVDSRTDRPMRIEEDFDIVARCIDGGDARRQYSTGVRAGGVFTLFVAEPGIYEIAADADYLATVRPSVDLRTKTSVSGVRLALRPDPKDAKIRIRVIDRETGQSIPTGWYRFKDKSFWGMGWFESGGFDQADCRVGPWRFEVGSDRHVKKKATVDVSLAQKTYEQVVALERSTTLRIVSVEKDGNGARAGLRVGDIVLRLGDTPIRCRHDLEAAASRAHGGKMIVRRDGAALQIELPRGDLGIKVENSK